MKARIPEMKRDKNITFCDKGCGKRFKIHMHVEDLGEVGEFGKCTRRYMECPHCHQQYGMGFLNAEVDELVAANVQLLKVFTKQSTRQIAKNKKLGERLMRRIEAAYRRMRDAEN